MQNIAIIFPGQGTQTALMGKDFYENYLDYKYIFDQTIMNDQTLKRVFEDENSNDINKTLYAQQILFANQISILNVIKNMYEVKDEVYAGFSLGEYSAIYGAGFTSIDQAKQIVKKRATLMDSVTSDYVTKVAIGKTKEQLEEIVKDIYKSTKKEIIISNYNLEKQLLINFKSKDEEEIINMLKNSNLKRLVDLKISGPFHTNVYDSASDEFYKYLKGIKFDTIKRPLYLNYTAQKLTDDDDLKILMKKQMTNGVLWYNEVKNMINDGIDTFIEVGSISVLSSMIKKIDKNVDVITIKNQEDLIKLEEVWTKK